MQPVIGTLVDQDAPFIVPSMLLEFALPTVAPDPSLKFQYPMRLLSLPFGMEWNGWWFYKVHPANGQDGKKDPFYTRPRNT